MSEWALILGCSTGHGGATAKKLAEQGYGIVGFHFDRGELKLEAEKTKEEISDLNGEKVVFWNTNAASQETMDKYIPQIKEMIKSNMPMKTAKIAEKTNTTLVELTRSSRVGQLTLVNSVRTSFTKLVSLSHIPVP